MKKYFLVILVFFVLNCAKTDYYLKNVNHKVRITSFSEEDGYKLKKRFELSHTRVNLFWGIWHVYNKDLDTLLSPILRSPETEAVGNLALTETYDFLDSITDLCTLGIVRLYSVKVKGDLYEFAAPPKKEESESLELPKEIESKETKSLETPAEEKKDEKKKVNKNVKKK